MAKWRDIEGYSGRYQVSGQGEVRSKDWYRKAADVLEARLQFEKENNINYIKL